MYHLVYRLFQKIIRKENVYSYLASYIKKKKILNIYDIGCADSFLLNFIDYKKKDVNYFGFDQNNGFIKKNKTKFVNYKNLKFYNKSVFQLQKLEFKKNSIILLCGIVHHVSDEEIIPFIENVKLQKKVIFAVDPLRKKNQTLLNRILIKYDRGKYIRNVNGYNVIFKGFDKMLYNNFEKVIYNHIMHTLNLDKNTFKKILYKKK